MNILSNVASHGLWRWDTEIHIRQINDDNTISIKINTNNDLLFANFPDCNDTEGKWWVKRNNKTNHQYQLHIKPFPYSDDNDKIPLTAYLWIDVTPKKKEAPKKPQPLLDTDVLIASQNKRTAIFNEWYHWQDAWHAFVARSKNTLE